MLESGGPTMGNLLSALLDLRLVANSQHVLFWLVWSERHLQILEFQSVSPLSNMNLNLESFLPVLILALSILKDQESGCQSLNELRFLSKN